jgi:uncharacterized protein (DUF362 family)
MAPLPGTALASADQVAIDAVAARLMGFDPLSIRYISPACLTYRPDRKIPA